MSLSLGVKLLIRKVLQNSTPLCPKKVSNKQAEGTKALD